MKKKHDFEKKKKIELINSTVFFKPREGLRRPIDTKLFTDNKRRNSLVLGANYLTTKWILGNLIVTVMKKTNLD